MGAPTLYEFDLSLSVNEAMSFLTCNNKLIPKKMYVYSCIIGNVWELTLDSHFLFLTNAVFSVFVFTEITRQLLLDSFAKLKL